MKQKIYSLFLLLSFLGIMAHDMIPHHHDGHAAEEHSEISHHEKHLDSDHILSEITDASCVKKHNLSDNHHECPHHFHNCLIKDYKLDFSGRSGISTPKVKIVQTGYFHSIHTILYLHSHSESLCAMDLSSMPNSWSKRIFPPRAPPSVA